MRVLGALVAAALVAGCSFKPAVSNGSFQCGDNDACPPGMICADDGHCYRPDALPDLGSGICTPTTCAALGKNCGAVSNGCGATVSCGTCDAPNTCGGGGPDNVCGCTPTTCAAQGKNCGVMPDGCNGTLECGPMICATGSTCVANVCTSGASCTPATCQANQCGLISDGCSKVLRCGGCAMGKKCVDNQCQ